jgi:hypothetical protein
MRQKSVNGFQTGDMVKANVTSGKKVGVYVGRVAVRATGSFNITTKTETVQGISYSIAHESVVKCSSRTKLSRSSVRARGATTSLHRSPEANAKAGDPTWRE